MATGLVVGTAVPAAAPRAYPHVRLLGGFLGRMWLWFLGGCLAVTLLPLLFGWRPYVVQSGSMLPRIHVGDVILAAPEHDAKKLLGHVAIFNDPEPTRAGLTKAHRVVRINPDGTLVTKGDANQTVDSVSVHVSQVRGLGRLLVRFVGLPLIWIQHGQWLQLGLAALSLWFAALLVMRDTEPPVTETAGSDADADDAGAGDDSDGDSDRDDGHGTSAGRGEDSDRQDGDDSDDVQPATSARNRFPRRLRALLGRTLAVALASLGLLLPTAQAALSATTKSTANSWSVPDYSYPTETINLGPYIYWRLDDAAASTTAIDSSGNARNGTYNSTWTKQVVGALVDEPTNLAVTETNAAAPAASVSCVYSPATASTAAPGPQVYTELIWFKTSSTNGGKLIGYENTQTGVSNSSSGGGQYDRMMYMDGNGRIWFAVWRTTAGTPLAISSQTGLNNGAWHMAAATMSATTGMALYIDGVQVATNANTISETETRAGFWRVGCGNLAGWGGAATWSGGNAPGSTAAANLNYPFNGSLDEATIYTSALTAAQITFLYWIR